MSLKICHKYKEIKKQKETGNEMLDIDHKAVIKYFAVKMSLWTE